MKRIFFLLLLISGILRAQDTARYISAGLIPYQFFSRSTGVFVSYREGRKAFEFRPTYTIPTGYVNDFIGIPHDRFLYRGVNGMFFFQYGQQLKWKLGLMAGFRYWWYNNQWITPDDIATWSSYASYKQKKSATMLGPCLGLELSRKYFFFTISYTHFSGSVSTFGDNLSPSTNVKSQRHFTLGSTNVALGWKIIIQRRVK